ncbi:hypothetical protein KKA02_03195 [Patescibacteria group bacterium]|nr:hypothetical protein [Patescibacteria group bacterium]
MKLTTNSQEYLKRLESAHKLLISKKVSFQTIKDIKVLIKGINPKIDKLLTSCSKTFQTLKQVQKGQVVELSEKAIKKLPAKSEKQKKRKKALLVFFKFWRQLRSEVKRVTKTYKSTTESKSPSTVKKLKNILNIGKIFTLAKGPFGIVTILATATVGIKLLLSHLNNSAVEVIIKNNNCPPITPISRSISLPGLKLPSQTITNGTQAIAKLPPLKLTIDARQAGIIKVTALKFSTNFKVENTDKNILLNGQPIIGQLTYIDLGQQKQHQLVISCQ